MERLGKERKSEVHRGNKEQRPMRKFAKLLVEGLAAVAAAGIIASCAASASVSARGGASVSASSSASSQPAGFDMPVLHESEVRLKRDGDTLHVEVHEITGIDCDAANRCSTSSEPLKSAPVTIERFDPKAMRYRQIDGCTDDKRTCDISKVPRGSRIRVRFVPPQDFERPVQGDSATTVRE